MREMRMIAYFDCFSGISGDMTLGALIDLGVPADWLMETLAAMPLDGFTLNLSSQMRGGIHCKQVDVAVDTSTTDRNYGQIQAAIARSPFSGYVKQRSLAVFERIAEAEAGIHGCSKDEIHFHEVGSVDAVVDIVGCMLGLERLGVETVYASAVGVGSGQLTCQHGTLPVPAPATLEILKGVPLYGAGIPHELTTPTGAAIIATLAENYGPIPRMVVERIGYGAGHRDNKGLPNALRIVLGKESRGASEGLPTLHKERIVVVEAGIDDMNPEIYGFLMDRLFEDGAVDVTWIPVYMKKNRPGTLVQVLCPQAALDKVSRRILEETTTLGVRFYDAHRRVLERSRESVDTSYGNVQVKKIRNTDGSWRLVPEYEVCRSIALEKQIPLRTVYDTLANELNVAGHWRQMGVPTQES